MFVYTQECSFGYLVQVLCIQAYLSIDHSCRRHRQAQGREGVPDGVVGAFLVHDEADIPAGRWDTEQVRRGYYHLYSRGGGGGVTITATAETAVMAGRSASL